MATPRVSGTEAARRVLDVLVSFSESRPEWSAAELASTLNQSKAMTYRYLALLREFGLVEPSGNSKFRVSHRAIGLADAAYAGRTDVVEHARPFMLELAEATSETVLLTKRVGWQMYCIERIDSTHPIRLQLDRGRPMPLHSGSLARVLLAAMDHAERAAYFDEIGLEPRPQLLDDAALDAVVEQGFAESQGEIDGGIWGFSVPVVRDGHVVAAMGVTAPFARNPEEALARIRGLVIDAGRRLTEAIVRESAGV